MRWPGLIDVGIVAGLAAGAVAHGLLYLHGYRVIPVVGPSFLVLTAISAALAVLILAGGPGWMRVGAAVAAAGALGAFALSRTVGFFGFVEEGWEPQPYAVLTVVAELAVVVLGLVTLRQMRRNGG
ncbi:MAG: hypothetical protein ACRDUB_08555 [Mycobacterium sp.]